MGMLALGVYALLLFIVARRNGAGADASSFFVNRRESSSLNVGLSVVVSCVGASATVGMAGMAFKIGTPAFWWLGSGACGLTLLALFLAKRVRRSNACTLPQLVEMLFGPQMRSPVAVIILIAWTAVLAAQFTAASRILEGLTDLDAHICPLLAFGLITLHTASGGQAAVMRTDSMQCLLMLFGLAALCLCFGGQSPFPLSTVTPEVINSEFPVERLMYYLCILGGSYLVCPMLFGRIFCAVDETRARRGALLGVCGLVIFAALIVTAGLLCRGLVPEETPADAVLTVALTTVLPPWLQIFVLTALLGAVISSADSCLLTAATVCSRDLLRREGRAHCRAAVLALACLGLAVSFTGKDILAFLLAANDVYVGGVVAPVACALLLGDKGRVHPHFARAAVLSGSCLGAAAALTDTPAWSYAGISISLLLTLTGAFIPFAASKGREWGKAALRRIPCNHMFDKT